MRKRWRRSEKGDNTHHNWCSYHMQDIDRGPDAVKSNEDNEPVRYLKQALAEGKPWHIALLEAIGMWTWPDENHNGHHYCYLIDGEAFDWLLLAERLLEEIAEAVPEEELNALLFYGRLPREISDDDFRELIGEAKYYAYLNHLYGVTVEKFVLLAIEEEIGKERSSHIFSYKDEGRDDAYQRLYGASQETLLRSFRDERGYTETGEIIISQLHEFTYWLFKYRLENNDKALVASDTRKGIDYINRQRQDGGIAVPGVDTSDIIEHGR